MSATEVAATAVTETVLDVPVLFKESSTRAVMLKLPAALGLHEIV